MRAYKDCFNSCRNLKFKPNPYSKESSLPNCHVLDRATFNVIQQESCPFYNKGVNKKLLDKIKEFIEEFTDGGVLSGSFLFSKRRR